MKNLIKKWLGIEYLEAYCDGITTCEKCQCLIPLNSAKEGVSEIRKKEHTSLFGMIIDEEEEYIYTPYYCHKCFKK